MKFILPVFFSGLLLTNLVNAQNFENKRKVPPILTNKNIKADSILSVRIVTNQSLMLKDWANKKGLVLNHANLLQEEEIYELDIPHKYIKELSNSDFVLFIDRARAKKTLETILLGHDLSLNKVSAMQNLFPNENGQGIVLSIKEEPYNQFDIDLWGRSVTVENQVNDQFSRHATEIATIAAGAGNTSPEFKGVSYKAYLTTSESTDLTPDNIEFLNKNQITVQNHSYGVGVENYYGIESFMYDLQVENQQKILHIFSSGNKGEDIVESGSYAGIPKFSNITGQFKVSKNTLCVGATNAQGKVWEFSSKGPTEDGRIKPEVVAYGSNGTSEAAALVSGLVASLQDAYYSRNGNIPNASLIKAILANSSDGEKYELSYDQGFGAVDALGSMRTVVDGNYKEEIISSGEEYNHRIYVPKGTRKLNVTLVWTDFGQEITEKKVLYNDLDLTVIDETNKEIIKPWKLSTYASIDSLKAPPKRARDSINNIEKVSIFRPNQGNYTLNVEANMDTGKSQTFSLVYEFEKESEWVFPVKDDVLYIENEYYLRWDLAPDNKELISLEWRKEDGEWENIANNIDPISKYYLWTPISKTIGKGKLRIIGESFKLESPFFFVSEPIKLNVEYVCNSKTLISWNEVSGAESYNVFRLGQFNMEPIANTKDTIYNINTLQEDLGFFSISAVVDKKNLKRSFSTGIDTSFGCLIKDFYLTSSFSNKAEINLILNSNVGVKKIALERKTGNEYKQLSIYRPSNTKKYKFLDTSPTPKMNTYRGKVTMFSGDVIYSSDLDFYHLPEYEITIAPNPVPKNEGLNLYSSVEGKILVEIFTLTGKKIQSELKDGFIRKIDISQLASGIYIVTVTANGIKTTKKIIVF